MNYIVLKLNIETVKAELLSIDLVKGLEVRVISFSLRISVGHSNVLPETHRYHLVQRFSFFLSYFQFY